MSLYPKEPLRPEQMCYPLRRREELTDSCRVWLTKLSSKNVFLEMKVILCSGREDLALRANFCFIPLFFSGREGWHYVLIFVLSSVLSGREGLALRANFWFILCSFRQGRLALRANFWFILCSFRQGRF